MFDIDLFSLNSWWLGAVGVTPGSMEGLDDGCKWKVVNLRSPPASLAREGLSSFLRESVEG